ncbi:MAG: aminoglycoside phosphotransferase family protein [Planctomycetes bacterium]|nr:aminoglycoside phosphotransferase family protein [Planctomycetota bacterium]
MNLTSAAVARAVVGEFAIDGELRSIDAFERGHIHDTFVSSWSSASGNVWRFLHQRMNEQVFPDVPALMNNIQHVTEHLRRQCDGDLRTLRLVPTRDGSAWLQHEHHGAWRTYVFLENTTSHDLCDDPRLAYDAAHAFGSFQSQLRGLDPALLQETIPDFFSSPHRLRQLDAARAADAVGRVGACGPELAFVESRRGMCSVFDDLLRNGRIPSRVVHGDTKLNNVLFCTESERPVCVVDLDTCMPGWSLYDFGDLVRFTAATCVEDEVDLDCAGMDPELYRALVQGYLDTASGFLGDEEVALMPLAAKLVTLTVGMRFLADHLSGDRYFKVAREGHNLDRARVQFRMVESMEQQDDLMRSALPRSILGRVGT